MCLSNPYRRRVIAAIVLATLVAPTRAQGLDPIGRIAPGATPLAQVAVVDLPALDRPAIALEDEQRHARGEPARFAIPQPLTASVAAAGTWDTLDAAWSLWRLRVRSPDASHLNLGLTACQLPPSARLIVYAGDYSHIHRPFTQADLLPDGSLWLPIVRGPELVLEIYVQTAQRSLLQARLSQAASGYRFFGAGPTAVATAGLPEGGCNFDVACPQAAPWTDQIPGIGAISIAGTFLCSGALLNNTAQDGRAYFLTAHHCQITAATAPTILVYWNYEHFSCGGAASSLSDFTAGASVRASWAVTDFTLLELNSVPNRAFGVAWLGWERVCDRAVNAAAIHHGAGLAKEMAVSTTPTVITAQGSNSSSTTTRDYLMVSYTLGGTAAGASGCPLLDDNRRVIGQLWGGNSTCTSGTDWFGRLSRSWNGGGTPGTRLSDWLDPIGSMSPAIDTWSPSSYRTFGPGCDGSLGPPELLATGTPTTGQSLQLNLLNLPQNVAILWTGLSKFASPLGPLPIDLTPLGLTGCTARISPDASDLVFGANNRGIHFMPIPPSGALAGTRFFQQAIVLDPGFNTAGLTLTEATVGIVNGLPGGRAPATTPEMVAITNGSFLMGSNATTGHPYYSGDHERPVHPVTISYDFQIGRYEVTQAQFQEVMGYNPSYHQGFHRGVALPDSCRMPVEWLTRLEAIAFCAALTARESAANRLPFGLVYRLPTEAEWEYCCRAGTTTEFSFGPTIACNEAAIEDNHHTGTTCNGNRPVPVGSFPPNAWGLNDMHGNVGECLDRWNGGNNYPPTAVVDPYVTVGTYPVVRGGSYNDDSDVARSAHRNSASSATTWQSTEIGFRVVLGPPR